MMLSPDRLLSSHGPLKREVVRQACDPCRARKAKCETNDARDSGVDWSEEMRRTRLCRRCARLGLDCTYRLPFGIRGPKRKTLSLTSALTAAASSDGTQATTSVSPPPLSAAGSNVSVNVTTSPGSQLNLTPREPVRFPNDVQQRLVSPRSVPTPGPPAGRFTQFSSGEELCSRDLLKQILQDYLEYLYPLIPVVHRPSFRRDLDADRDLYNADFLGLVLGLCAVTVGTMPSRFKEYRNHETPLRFQTRREMIEYCYDRIHCLRGHDHFENINLQKWAASWLMGIALFQIGEHNQVRMIEVESMQLARLLGLHQIAEYEGLNCVETQLRKEAFWLLFYGYVQASQLIASSHDQYQNLRKERLTYLNPSILASIDLENLMPLEVDDEQIFENTILPQPAGTLSVVTGFNIHSRVFWTALESTKEKDQSCYCVRSRQSESQFNHLKSRLQDLHYILDGIPPQLQHWQAANDDTTLYSADAHQCRLLKAQFSTMRANLHVTHLWLQSIISDQLDAILLDDATREKLGSSAPSLETSWVAREHLCRQVLHTLYAIPDAYIEPNGHHLTYKVRDVAVGLLTCPFEPGTDAAKRASEYLREFARKLCSLDGSEIFNTMSLQSWVDTDRSYFKETR